MADPNASAELIVAEKVAEAKCHIVGFTAFGPGARDIYGDRGEIKQLYVDQSL